MKITIKDIQNYQILNSASIRQTAKQLDLGGIGFITIVDNENKVLGIVTDGDFRRAILNGINLNESVLEIINRDFAYVEASYSTKEVINIFLQKNIYKIPELLNGKLMDILFRENFNLDQKFVLSEEKQGISVLIMAGGKGTRMMPFTNILPKPLIPIGEKSMLEVIMDEYNLFFDTKFHISVNYKANLIKAYLDEYKNEYNFTYIEENKPLGTGGALKFLQDKIDKPFFVSNCDILIKADYNSIYKNHLQKSYDISVIASMLHYKIPYGVCEINNGGELLKLVEKPEYDFLVNAGMYIINPELLEHIPENQFYNITNLINKVKEKGGKVGVFPVSEKSYLDAGQWKEYGEMLNSLQ